MITRRIAAVLTVVTLGCAPIDDPLDTAVEALTGAAPAPPASQSIPGVMGSNAWSNGAGSNRWSEIRLADVDGNGLDDLCGYYGDSWGCALRLRNTWFEGFVESREVTSFYRGTVRLADVTGDGRADVCGRDRAGYRCLYATATPTTLSFVAPLMLFGIPFAHVPHMSDANGWGAPGYETTVMFGRLQGIANRMDLCARGSGGVMCHYGFHDGYPMANIAVAPEFSNAAGWNLPEHYSTLALADIDGDGDADLCGRGSGGILCARFDKVNNRFLPATSWTTQYSNAAGWQDARYYRSIRFGDINNDGRADVCGRGEGGVHCGISDGQGRFNGAEASAQITGFSNTAGFAGGDVPASLMLVDYDGDNRSDVCMVGPYRTTTSTGASTIRQELFCARSRTPVGGPPGFEAVFRRTDLSALVASAVAGTIRPNRRGYCYVDSSGLSVRCTNAW